ncbi:MAG TPA: hypothetical protein VGP72_03085 [Planctomycetota bacterium]|jgi:hypothetical protein
MAAILIGAGMFWLCLRSDSNITIDEENPVPKVAPSVLPPDPIDQPKETGTQEKKEPAVRRDTGPTAKVGDLIVPASTEARLVRLFDQTVKVYLEHGQRDKKWDQLAVDALWAGAVSLGEAEPTNNWETALYTSRAAREAGCRDPLVTYVLGRYEQDFSGSPAAQKELFDAAAAGMREAKYPELYRFYATVRAAAAWRQTEARLSESLRAKCAAMLNDALIALTDALKDPELPLLELDGCCCQFMNTHRTLEGKREPGYERLAAVIEQQRPNSALGALIAGQYYMAFASDLHAAGGEFSPANRKLYDERLALARKNLEQSWSLQHSALAASNLIDLAAAEKAPLAKMEEWFAHAMETNPNDFDSYFAKLNYLAPHQCGSAKQMLEFGQFCAEQVQAGKIRNLEVAVMLAEAHDVLSVHWMRENKVNDDSGYWKPSVWYELKKTYKFLIDARPESHYFRSQFACYALKCRETAELDAQLKVLGNDICISAFRNLSEYTAVMKRSKQFLKK